MPGMNNFVGKSVKIWAGRKIYYFQLNIPLKESEGPHSSSRVCNVFLAREELKKVLPTRAPMAALREIRTGTQGPRFPVGCTDRFMRTIAFASFR